jgi:hypothetical protein
LDAMKIYLTRIYCVSKVTSYEGTEIYGDL